MARLHREGYQEAGGRGLPEVVRWHREGHQEAGVGGRGLEEFDQAGLEIRGSKCYHVLSFATGMLKW